MNCCIITKNLPKIEVANVLAHRSGKWYRVLHSREKSKNSLVQYCKNVDQIYFDTRFFVWRRVSAWVNDRMVKNYSCYNMSCILFKGNSLKYCHMYYQFLYICSSEKNSPVILRTSIDSWFGRKKKKLVL